MQHFGVLARRRAGTEGRNPIDCSAATARMTLPLRAGKGAVGRVTEASRKEKAPGLPGPFASAFEAGADPGPDRRYGLVTETVTPAPLGHL